jgi:rfaE bifunctional protein nucleotidyltransferase chain/domain
MRTVLADGCFDVLHPGHISHLLEARSMGDRLIVSLTLDEYVRERKGTGHPVYQWEERASVLRELRCVDDVVPSVDLADAVLRVKPHIVVKGVDYANGTLPQHCVDACSAVGAELRFTVSHKQSVWERIRRVSK